MVSKTVNKNASHWPERTFLFYSSTVHLRGEIGTAVTEAEFIMHQFDSFNRILELHEQR